MKDMLLFNGCRARILVDGEETGGRLGLIELTELAGSRTPPHLHHHDVEAVYVLDGLTRVEMAGRTTDLLPGDIAIMRPGVAHRLSIPQVETRHLVVVSPAAFVDFVRKVGLPADAATPLRHPTPEELAPVRRYAADFGIALLPPEALDGPDADPWQPDLAPPRETQGVRIEEIARLEKAPTGLCVLRVTLAPGAVLPRRPQTASTVYVIEGALMVEGDILPAGDAVHCAAEGRPSLGSPGDGACTLLLIEERS